MFKNSGVFLFCILSVCSAVLFFSSYTPQPDSGGVGVRSYAHVDVNDTVSASTVLHSSVLTTPIAASAKVHVHYSLPFILSGTAPGIKFQVTTPTGAVSYNSAAIIYSDADSIVAVSVITTAAAQGFTLATTGNHYATIDFDLINGSTAGNVVLQFAQNVSDAANTILMKGAWADITKF